MIPDAHREALLVTARVTQSLFQRVLAGSAGCAGLALIGCGGSVAVPTDTHVPVPDPTSTQPPTAVNPPEPAQRSVGLACNPPQAECCNAIFDRIDKDWAEYSKVNHEVLWKCCQQEDPNFTRAACTPWGPPMPPEMVS